MEQDPDQTLPSSSTDKSLKIQKRLEGKFMNQIVKETGISKGKVQYITKEWENKLGTSSANEIIEFATQVKKPDIMIEQCAQGFRMMNVLKEMKIGSADIADDEDEDDHSRSLSFIEEIYNNCKKLEISPAIIVSWIKDLIDCRSLIDINKKEVFEVDVVDDIIEQQITTTIPTQEKQQHQVKNLKDFEGSINNPNLNDNKKTRDSYIEPLTSDKVPFVSQVSFFITEKKKEIDKLNNHQRAIEKNLRLLKEQEKKTIKNLDIIIQKEKFAISYINWFSNLEQSLQQNYNIDIKEDIQTFSQLINDFKEKGYDANEIIQEYLKSLSVKLELKTNEDNIQ